MTNCSRINMTIPKLQLLLRSALTLSLVIYLLPEYYAQPSKVDGIARFDNYPAYHFMPDILPGFHYTTQNGLNISLTLQDSLFPYRGDFAKKSEEILKADRVYWDKLMKSIENSEFSSFEYALYNSYWDPYENDKSTKFIDLILTRLSNSEIPMTFDDEVIQNSNKEANELLVPSQNSRILQFGKLTEYPHLTNHWYFLREFDSKIQQRDLGVIQQVTHIFVWNRATYSVTFNINGILNSKEYQRISMFLSQFGKINTKNAMTFSDKEWLKVMVQNVYADQFALLSSKLSEDEMQLATECAVQRLSQLYSTSEIKNLTFDENLFMMITIGCIEYIRL
jgi:hypothetical protein